MNDLAKLLEMMTKRLEEIESGMKKEGASIHEQKHLDKGSSERAYWHHGYASALRDLLKARESRNARHAA